MHSAVPAMPSSAFAARTPLPASLVLAWVNSLAASALTVGIFFITKSAYGFSPKENLLLALVMGVAYIPGAAGVGPAMRRLAARLPWLSTRGVLGSILVALACIAAIPACFPALRWVIWPVTGAHLMISGALWPITESYLSGGRSGADLRRATARFNLTWSSASFAVMWLSAPLLEKRPLTILLIAAGLHLASLVVLPFYGAEPGEHAPDAHEPHPPVYERLLIVFRWLLPTGYMLAYCLSPLMPTLVERAGMAGKTINIAGEPWSWATPIASMWLFARIGAFALFGRWQGWHGKWLAAWLTGGTMLLGFALAVTSASLPTLLAGLALFGLGLGGVYACALYYALEVGKAEIDAGGAHETLIGVGYTVGPIIGLIGFLAPTAATAGRDAGPNPWLTVAVAAALAVGTVSAAAWHALRRGAA